MISTRCPAAFSVEASTRSTAAIERPDDLPAVIWPGSRARGHRQVGRGHLLGREQPIGFSETRQHQGVGSGLTRSERPVAIEADHLRVEAAIGTRPRRRRHRTVTAAVGAGIPHADFVQPPTRPTRQRLEAEQRGKRRSLGSARQRLRLQSIASVGLVGRRARGVSRAKQRAGFARLRADGGLGEKAGSDGDGSFPVHLTTPSSWRPARTHPC